MFFSSYFLPICFQFLALEPELLQVREQVQVLASEAAVLGN